MVIVIDEFISMVKAQSFHVRMNILTYICTDVNICRKVWSDENFKLPGFWIMNEKSNSSQK